MRFTAFWGSLDEDGGMLTVTEPQVWTMFGVFTALMFGMLTTVSTLFVRVVRSEISRLRGEMSGLHGEIGGLRNEMNGQIGGLRAEMNARFDAVHVKIDGLDRDVQLLMSREFGKDRD